MRSSTLGIFIFISLISFSQLPDKWMGHYKGELISINLEGKETKFGMELIISERKDSTYNFTIIYSTTDVHQERAYRLIPDGTNHFMLDELNGIVVDMSLSNNRLVSFFEVQESFLHVSYILTKKGLRFELTSSTPSGKTGGIITENKEEIPEVQSYRTISFQFATLKRSK